MSRSHLLRLSNSALAVLLLVGAAHAQNPGTPDPEFGTDGRVEITFTGNQNASYAAHQQPNGKLLLASQLAGFFVVVRLHEDGLIDTGFGSSGYAGVVPGAAFSVKLQPDDKIVAGGQLVGDLGVVRFNPNGTRDADFGVNGVAVASLPDATGRAYSVVRQDDGRLIAAGVAFEAKHKVMAARFTTQGALDTSFGEDGVFLHAFEGLHAEARTAVMRPDGSMVLMGFVRPVGAPTPIEFLALGMTPDGALDTAFANDGVFRMDASVHVDAFLHSVLDDEGRIVAAGASGTDFAVARFTPTGVLDPSFGTDGMVTHGTPDLLEEARFVAIQEDGKIIIGGRSGVSNGPHSFAAARLHPNGALDTGYADDGIGTYNFSQPASYGLGGVLQEDERLVVVGWTGTTDLSTFRPAILRLLDDGKIDNEPVAGAPGFVGIQVFPSPVRETATIEVAVPAGADVRVVVYDLLGRAVSVVHDGPMASGQALLSWSASGIPAGQYVVRLMSEDQSAAQLLTVVR